MLSASRYVWIAVCLWAALFPSAAARADLVKLKSGGELRGVFLDEVAPGRAVKVPVRVETLTGGVITVSHEDVAFVTRRHRNLEEYEWRTRLAPPTADAHWELQGWCRTHGMKKERDEELRQVVTLDPTHEAAHRMLGHIREGGKWQTRDEAMAAKGYVKYKGKYLFPQEVELLEASNLHKESETAWHKKLHQWQSWLRSGNPSHQLQARQELEAITDPDAIAPLVKLYRNDSADDVRLIFVRTLARLQAPTAVHALVLQSLFDTSPSVRVAALEGIQGKSRDIAIPIYSKALSDSLNEVVLRAAVALGYFGDTDAVPALIDALVTTHTYRQVVQERGYIAQGAIPGLPQAQMTMTTPRIPLTLHGIPLPISLGGGAPYPLGTPSSTTTVPIPTPVIQNQVVEVTRQHQNVEVLAALRKLTREDFGYDQRTWKLWWSTQHGGAKTAATQR